MEPHSRAFRFAISGFARTLADWRDFARKAEDLGYSSLLIPDHFGSPFAPLPALIAAAAATTRLRVGTLVFDNDFRHPAVLAKEAATADVMTDGRFELGIGAGWMASDYEKTGIPFEAASIRVNRLEETLTIVKAFFTGQPVTFCGKHYQIRDLDAVPRPVQQPRPPIMIGGTGKRMLSIAGREVDIVSIQGHPDPPRNLWGAVPADYFARQLDIVRSAAGPRYAGIEISVLADTYITDDRRSIADRLGRQMGVEPEVVLGMPAVFTGSAEAVAEQLLERRERYDISYPVIFSQMMDAMAPVVARLAGK
ncbi:MAG: TIGR03621 family F420-dependent LLM class oxidoreductase [Chloroflexi bacterium]|nr:TIGR03621 family F420-dependent LLM class oxidoreductase [Chloroflexota bacterium]